MVHFSYCVVLSINSPLGSFIKDIAVTWDCTLHFLITNLPFANVYTFVQRCALIPAKLHVVDTFLCVFHTFFIYFKLPFIYLPNLV